MENRLSVPDWYKPILKEIDHKEEAELRVKQLCKRTPNADAYQINFTKGTFEIHMGQYNLGERKLAELFK